MMELPRPAIVSPAPPARQAAPARDVALSLAAASVARGVCLAGGRCPRVARWQKQAEILDVPVVTSKVNKHYGTTIVSTKEEAQKVMEILLSLKDHFHAVDTETRGWTPDESPHLHGEIICWSVYCGSDVNFGNGPRLFIDNLKEDGKLQGLVECFKEYLEDPTIPKVFQNYSFDRAMFLHHGIRVEGFAADTMHLARLDNSDADGYSLEALGVRYMGPAWGKQDLRKLMAKVGTKDVSDLHLSKDVKIRHTWIDYSTFDTMVTWNVHQKLRTRLMTSRLPGGNLMDFYDTFWKPFADVLAKIEERGIRIEQKFLQKQLKVAQKDLEEAQEAFLDWLHDEFERRYPEHLAEIDETWEKFNPSSTKQMKHVLYGKGVEVVAGVALGGLGLNKMKGKTPESTGAEAIEKLAGKAPEADNPATCGLALEKIGVEGCIGLSHMSERAGIGKAISCFLEKLSSDELSDERGRVHTSLRVDTRTGRLTSSNPNLQQVPAVEKDRYKVRSAVVPEEGKSFIVADYGQLDLRVLAHTSRCPNLIKALSSGIDLHSHTAAKMYPHLQREIDLGELSLEGGTELRTLKDEYPSERRSAKAVNFGIAYGLTKCGLAQQLRCPENEAEVMIRKWYEAYPRVEEWQHETVKTAEMSDLTVKTYRGRPRHLFNLMKKPKKSALDKRKKGMANTAERDQWWAYICAVRQAINAPVQGGSADLVLEAMVKADRDEELARLGYEMVLQVHDELIFEGPEENAEEALAAVKRVMESPFLDDYNFAVPLVVDAKVATSWHEAKHA